MVNDWEKLGITPVNDKEYIYQALLESVREANFETDLEQVFKYIDTYNSLIARVDRNASEIEKVTLQKKSLATDDEMIIFFDSESVYATPEQLVMRFEEIYANSAWRFNMLIWKSAIANAKTHGEDELTSYCLPLMRFFTDHYVIKSDVIEELRSVFPFYKLFNSKEWNKEIRVLNPELNKVAVFLMKPHVEVDLYIDCLKDENLSLLEMDLLIKELFNADIALNSGQMQQAFSLLSNQIPDEKKPAFVWRKMLNIVFRAAFEYRHEGTIDIFASTLDTALSFFPKSSELLYMQALYVFKAESNLLEVQKQLIAILKIIPSSEKCYYLLAKNYLQQNKFEEALHIFQRLQKLDPLNGAYIVYTATSFRYYITNRLNDSSFVRDEKFYFDILQQLIELNLFDEIREIAAEMPLTPDLEAILLFSQALEQYGLTWEKDFDKLEQALALTENKEIVFRVKKLYLSDMDTWTEIASRKDLIASFYEEFPDKWISVYHKARYFYSITDYQSAYEYYLKAIELDADSAFIYFSMAQVCERLERYEEAVKYISIDMQKSRYRVESSKIMAICCYRVGDYSRALKEYKWLFSLMPPKDICTDHLYYYVCSLYNYLDSIEGFQGSVQYKTTELKAGLELFESLPKPENFYNTYNGSEALFWLSKLCKLLGLNEEGLYYARQILSSCTQVEDRVRDEAVGFELAFMRTLKLNQELIDTLLTKTTEGMEKDPNNPVLALHSFYIAFAFEGLGDLDNELKWKLKTAYYYADMDVAEYKTDTQLEWLETFTISIVNRFERIFEHEKTICAAKAYFNIQKAPHFRYIMVSYYMAIAYEALGDKQMSLQYHQKVVEYEKQFPGYFNEYTEISRLILNIE